MDKNKSLKDLSNKKLWVLTTITSLVINRPNLKLEQYTTSNLGSYLTTFSNKSSSVGLDTCLLSVQNIWK